MKIFKSKNSLKFTAFNTVAIWEFFLYTQTKLVYHCRRHLKITYQTEWLLSEVYLNSLHFISRLTNLQKKKKKLSGIFLWGVIFSTGQLIVYGMTKNDFPLISLSLFSAAQQNTILASNISEIQFLHPKNIAGKIKKIFDRKIVL